MIALKLLNEVEREGMMDRSLKEGALSIVDQKDRAFFKELVWGVLRNKRYLDFQIDRFLKKPNKIPIPIRNILRLGMYELIFMNMPDYAVVKEIVDLVRVRKFKSLVNAVLRRFLREGTIKPENPAVEFSLSDDVYTILKKSLNEKILKKVLDFLKTKAKVFLRVNLNKIDVDKFIELMKRKGWNLKKCEFPPECVEVVKFGEWIGESEEFKKGFFYIQDKSSQLVPYILNLKKGQRILDMCSGPGGKATHIAQYLKCECKVLAIDISKERLDLVKENAKRLGLNCIDFLNIDVRNYETKDRFSRIVLDAPCTSIGTGNKNPDVILRLSKKDFEKMAKTQISLLKKAINLLETTGRVLYSVCTVSKFETTDVVKGILKDEICKDVKVVNVSRILDEFSIDNLWDGYGSLIVPENGYSPMYYSILEKR